MYQNRMISATAFLFIILNVFNGFCTGWEPVINADTALERVSSFFTRYDTIYVGTGTGSVFCSSGDLSIWEQMGDGFTSKSPVLALCKSDGKLYAGTHDNGLYWYSTDDSDWITLEHEIAAGDNLVSMCTAGDTICIGTEKGCVVWTDDEGDTWNTIAVFGSPLRTLVAENGFFYAGSESEGLFITSDIGGEWKNSTGPVGINCLCVNDTDVFVSLKQWGNIHSSDRGARWNMVDTTAPVTTSFFHSRGLLFAGTDQGVELSKDNGETWESVNEGLPEGILAFAAANGNYAVAAVEGQGVMRRSLDEMVDVIVLEIVHEYDMPNNSWRFRWDYEMSGKRCEVYGDDVLIYRTTGNVININVNNVISSIEQETGREIGYGPVNYHLVVRSNDSNVVAISDNVLYTFWFAIPVTAPAPASISSCIRISGEVIDCSALDKLVAVTLFSLNGKKVLEKRGIRMKTVLPDHLSPGLYTMIFNGSFGRIERNIMKK